MDDLDWRHMPSLSMLRAFEATARLGSFSAAGQALNVTHAAISQQVRGLERELATPLVERQGKGMTLTAAGNRLAARLGEGFRVISDGVAELKETGLRQGLRVTCTPALSQAFLIPKLASFWDLHPEIPVSITPSPQVANMRLQGFDLGIRTGSGEWPDLDAEPLWHSPVVLVAGELLVERYGGDVRNLPLADMPWIRSRDHPEDDELIQQGGVDPEKTRAIYIEGQGDCVQAAMRGVGLTFISELAIIDELRAGTMMKVPFEIAAAYTYYLVTPKGVHRPEVRTFVSWLKKLHPQVAT